MYSGNCGFARISIVVKVHRSCREGAGEKCRQSEIVYKSIAKHVVCLTQKSAGEVPGLCYRKCIECSTCTTTVPIVTCQECFKEGKVTVELAFDNHLLRHLYEFMNDII